jgi:hypothetical protein
MFRNRDDSTAVRPSVSTLTTASGTSGRSGRKVTRDGRNSTVATSSVGGGRSKTGESPPRTPSGFCVAFARWN